MKKILITIGILIFSVWTLFLISFSGCIFRSSHICYLSYVHTFNSGAWKNTYNTNEEKILNRREYMAMDLIKKKSLLGKTKKEITEILGMEDNNTNESTWRYWIRPTTVDNLFFEVNFENDRVIKNSFYED